MLKAIIPVKSSSTRVPEKNFRPFFGGKSLFDLTAEKIRNCLRPEDVYVSCEDPAREEHARRYGFNFIRRDPVLAENSTPLPDLMRGVCAQVPGESDIMWCQVIEPMFEEYAQCVRSWESKPDDCDSLVVVHRRHGYFLDEAFRPQGFGFGMWHITSQQLPARYQLTFVLAIVSRDSLRKTGYYVGAKPHWYVARNQPVDIDTMEDFEMARAVYGYYHKLGMVSVGAPALSSSRVPA